MIQAGTVKEVQFENKIFYIIDGGPDKRYLGHLWKGCSREGKEFFDDDYYKGGFVILKNTYGGANDLSWFASRSMHVFNTDETYFFDSGSCSFTDLNGRLLTIGKGSFNLGKIVDENSRERFGWIAKRTCDEDTRNIYIRFQEAYPEYF